MGKINGRDGKLLLDAVDRSDEATSWSFGPGTKQTFKQMRAQVPTVLTMTITQDDATGTLYSMALAAAGTSVPGVYKPHGNDTASAAQPHYTFTAIPSGPTGDVTMGGDASDDSTQALTVEVTWQITTWTKVAA